LIQLSPRLSVFAVAGNTLSADPFTQIVDSVIRFRKAQKSFKLGIKYICTLLISPAFVVESLLVSLATKRQTSAQWR